MFLRFFKLLFSLSPKPPIKKGTVSFDEISISIERGSTPPVELKWSEIDVIATFKRDLFTHDMVCLVFGRRNPDSVIEIYEDFTGFGTLIPELSKRFPEIPEDWYFKVVGDPFKANTMILFKRI